MRTTGSTRSVVAAAGAFAAATFVVVGAHGRDARYVEPMALSVNNVTRVLAVNRSELEIGRASCRERVEISVGGVSLKKKGGGVVRDGREEERSGGRTCT